jgi:ABC-type sugar transport system substrate-binding protein
MSKKSLLSGVSCAAKAVILAGIASLAFASAASADDADLTLKGKKIGVAVVGTQHFWDREAFNGAVETVKSLGGEVLPTDGGRDNQVHANNHDIFLTNKVDAVISILGDASVEPKFKALRDAGIPVFTVDHVSPYSINNTTSDNWYIGSSIGRFTAEALNGKGNVAVFNAFEGSLHFCAIRAQQWKYVLKDYPDIHIIEPELAEAFANAPEDARKKTLDLLTQYPKGALDAIHVACWDQPAIGVVQAGPRSRSLRSTQGRRRWRSSPRRTARSSPTSLSSRTRSARSRRPMSHASSPESICSRRLLSTSCPCTAPNRPKPSTSSLATARSSRRPGWRAAVRQCCSDGWRCSRDSRADAREQGLPGRSGAGRGESFG